MASSCQTPGGQGGDPGDSARAGREPSAVAVWGCEHAIRTTTDRLDPAWREEATVEGDLGFLVTEDDFSGLRRHENADIEVKLPVVIEGDTAVTVELSSRRSPREPPSARWRG
jgi:hypothetical protein